MLEVGEAGIDHIPESRRPTYFEMAKDSPDQSFVLASEITKKVFFNDMDDDLAAHYYEKLTP